jgi:hypothetical protein
VDKNVFDILQNGKNSHKKENSMKKNNDETSEGLNQLFEIINAKGDTGELREIVEQNNDSRSPDQQQQSE